ncbi:MAG TPA: hypothetical protein VGI60_06405 [Chthoniobacterales bacterium]|jgi:hypothetical protein
MKTNAKSFLILFVLITAALISARADLIKSTYIGPIGGNWSDPANWSPPIVPNNTPDTKFLVRVPAESLGVILDLDVHLNKLKLTQDYASTFAFGVSLTDFDLRSRATSLGVDFAGEQYGGGLLYLTALTRDTVADLGNLADFSGTTFNTGLMVADASAADPGVTATIRFNGADVYDTSGYIGIYGARSRIVDENGRNALRHLDHILFNGFLDVETGRNFRTTRPLVNEGSLLSIATGFIGPDAPTTVTIDGDYTGIGYPLDVENQGVMSVAAPGPTADATVVINGNLTNYDAASRTLHKTYYGWGAAGGRSATTRVLGIPGTFDIQTSEASLVLTGPNTGFRDRNGQDALRNLSSSARMLIGDRDFTTIGSFTTTSRLSIFGDTQFTVNGDLTVAGGFLELWPLTGYAYQGEYGFPLDPAYLPANLLVAGSFNLPAESILRFHIFDANTLATMTVNGTVTLAGSLQSGVDDVSQLSQSDTITVMTANQIVGQFANVQSGGRVNSYVGFDIDNNPIGDPLGSFLVTYDNTNLVLSDFQPAENAAGHKRVRASSSRPTLDGEE